eukprot:jgi/Psemu1/45757/gm1.45757_g
MTDTIIQRVHNIANEQAAPSGLTFRDRHGCMTILHLDNDSTSDDGTNGSYRPDPAEDATADNILTGVSLKSHYDGVIEDASIPGTTTAHPIIDHDLDDLECAAGNNHTVATPNTAEAIADNEMDTDILSSPLSKPSMANTPTAGNTVTILGALAVPNHGDTPTEINT